MTVPTTLVSAIDGLPSIGVPDQAFVLLTVDATRFPRPCLLSRAQIACRGHAIALVVAGRVTPVNLERERRATLLAVSDDALVVSKLSIDRVVTRDGLTGVRGRIVDHRVDSAGVPLHGMSFVPSDDLPAIERWSETQSLLDSVLTSAY